MVWMPFRRDPLFPEILPVRTHTIGAHRRHLRINRYDTIILTLLMNKASDKVTNTRLSSIPEGHELIKD
jgi:hypothetical protein